MTEENTNPEIEVAEESSKPKSSRARRTNKKDEFSPEQLEALQAARLLASSYSVDLPDNLKTAHEIHVYMARIQKRMAESQGIPADVTFDKIHRNDTTQRKIVAPEKPGPDASDAEKIKYYSTIKNNEIARMRLEASKLIRVRVSDNAPTQGDSSTADVQYCGVENDILKEGRFFALDKPWHLPKSIVEELEGKKFARHVEMTDEKTKQIYIETTMKPRYNIKYLEPLSVSEFEAIQKNQIINR